MNKNFSLGIDFGTTSLSAVIYNNDNKQVIQSFSIQTNAYIKTTDPLFAEQDIQIISKCFDDIIGKTISLGLPVESIGFTGQMHGIVGLDSKGNAITNLVTWQDRRGSHVRSNGSTILNEMKGKVSGLSVSDGYGLVTLYYWLNIENHKDIVSFCTLPDYFVKQLCHLSSPVMHASMAHSIGAFDIFPAEKWNRETITALDLQRLQFPEISQASHFTGRSDLQGRLNKEVPVTVAIGDNQASYLGSVGKYQGSLLINVGTGTQLSYSVEKGEISNFKEEPATEIRPYINNQVLISTSLISGGNVYAALYDFFMQCGIQLFDIEVSSDKNVLYKKMEQLARNALQENSLAVDPLLFASRNDIGSSGIIRGLTKDNFTPGNLVGSFLKGMAAYYKSGVSGKSFTDGQKIFGSGNGIKSNSLFREILEKEFGCPLELTNYNEEAAAGAAIFASM